MKLRGDKMSSTQKEEQPKKHNQSKASQYDVNYFLNMAEKMKYNPNGKDIQYRRKKRNF